MLAHATILAAEDQENGAVLLREAHKAAGLPNPLIIVQDGQYAVDYLKGTPPYDDRLKYPLPGMLFLDLKMPRMDGFAVLDWLLNSSQFSALPAIVLSDSALEVDILRAKRLGARDYLVKPFGYHLLIAMLKDAVQKWLPAAQS